MTDRIYPALVLNDYPGEHYATWIEQQKKTLETRFRKFSHRGDLVICCGNKSVSANKGKALCIVNLFDARPMENTQADEDAAKIAYAPGRIVHLLKDWQYFSRKFHFTHYYVSGTYQGIFKIRIPDDVQIIQQPKLPL